MPNRLPDAFRYADLPPELQLLVLLKALEGIKVELIEKVVKLDPATRVHQDTAHGAMIDSHEKTLDEPLKLISTVKSSENILNLLLVSHDFQRLVWKALERSGSVRDRSLLFVPRDVSCSSEDFKILYLRNRLSIDDCIRTARVSCSRNEVALKRARFKNLSCIDVSFPPVHCMYGTTTRFKKDLPRYCSLQDFYYGKVDEWFYERGLASLDETLSLMGTTFAELLTEGLTVRWHLIVQLETYCGNCKEEDCVLSKRQLNITIVGSSSGYHLENVDLRECCLDYECEYVIYAGEGAEMLALHRINEAQRAGDSDLQ